MVKKKCDRCRKYSYSTDTSGRWICPYCQRDITHVKSELPNRIPVRRASNSDLMGHAEALQESVV